MPNLNQLVFYQYHRAEKALYTALNQIGNISTARPINAKSSSSDASKRSTMPI
jgi:hypothetical protein|tara:strand:+ start:4151 stop:4309 length:159 start_codon:yes stop_codon:yes gene_type:complete